MNSLPEERVVAIMKRSDELVLADVLQKLYNKCPESWCIEKEPHDYDDGTTHFNHVVFNHVLTETNQAGYAIRIGEYLDPDTAELLVLLKNNLPTIIEALRK